MDRSGTGLEQPNNFDIYYNDKVKYIVDSICFPINSQSNVSCPSTFPNPPPPPLFPNLSSTTQAIFESPVTEGCGKGINFLISITQFIMTLT